MLSRVLARRFTTSAIRRSEEWQQHGLPGSNLPFQINSKYGLTAGFILFFGSGFAVPFLIVRYQLLKKQ